MHSGTIKCRRVGKFVVNNEKIRKDRHHVKKENLFSSNLTFNGDISSVSFVLRFHREAEKMKKKKRKGKSLLCKIPDEQDEVTAIIEKTLAKFS